MATNAQQALLEFCSGATVLAESLMSRELSFSFTCKFTWQQWKEWQSVAQLMADMITRRWCLPKFTSHHWNGYFREALFPLVHSKSGGKRGMLWHIYLTLCSRRTSLMKPLYWVVSTLAEGFHLRFNKKSIWSEEGARSVGSYVRRTLDCSSHHYGYLSGTEEKAIGAAM